ncbi:hypothetical protein QJS10_CPA07g00842 [Acorus calamus]|uniref:Phytocyanin domain-containing protein n=1 Tax=Acorus calamus TaxID=4465 RepID=A0AAV9EI89_ACOCL|nr:hypothetical protein QJS10_CPA07g00842 [Acorus calamus]
MGCSLFGFVAAVLVFFGARLVAVGAEEFKVGGEDGWREPDKKDFYNLWAGKIRFRVGDSIYFVYHDDSVLAVDKAGYYHCNATRPYATFTDGNTTFSLDRPGLFYFSSGHRHHCEHGQRLIVDVLHSSPSSSPPLSAPTSSSTTASALGTVAALVAAVVAVVMAAVH